MFQPTRPVRGAARDRIAYLRRQVVSTHAPRTGRGKGHGVFLGRVRVSTHAPRTGRGGRWGDGNSYATGFNPRAPYGARLRGQDPHSSGWLFQPTRPVRGAAKPVVRTEIEDMFQPTRPVRGAAKSSSSLYS